MALTLCAAGALASCDSSLPPPPPGSTLTAETIATRETPGLVLADIQLADGSSGLDAVDDILKLVNVPVIFITAYPERLLTGDRPEPTYLITKPFQEATVRAAISQALFFGSSRPLS